MIRLQDVVTKVESYHPGADLDLIKRAYVFADQRHEGQARMSGEPYIVHPLGVAGLIGDLKLDVASVCAGILHDTVEDTGCTVEQIGSVFGKEVAFLVDGVTKLGKIPWNSREERQAENFRKMLLAMARDIRVILIKLCDRVDNMRTLGHMPPEKRERIALETAEIYAPLANRLGIQWIKVELEDLAFRYLQPEEFKDLSEKVARHEKEKRRYVEDVAKILMKELAEAGVRCEAYGRLKHLWSIYQKIKRSGRDLDQIYDIFAFRILCDTNEECYRSFGVVHSKWTPIPGRFKDYIALPKPNMYQSLHTSVIGPRGERIEIQIRTHEMHRIAESGIAAHWRYKEGRPADPKGDKEFAWLRQLMEWQQDLKDPTEFIESVKVDLFADEVYVFTPKGDVKALPKGSTPVDFAFAVHTEVGYRCSGARVNGLIVPLRYQLRNGDTIDVLTSPQQKPNKDWMKFVATTRARNKIRHYIRTEQRERSRTLGRELLERELRKYGVALNKVMKGGDLGRAAQELKAGSAEDLLILLGYGKVTSAQVAELVIPEETRRGPVPEEPPPGPLTQLIRKVLPRRDIGGIKVQGEDDVMVRFAKCCNPVQGDPIIGFITRGRGVTVHTRECKKAFDLDPDRRVDVSWDGKSKAPRPVSLQVICADKPGLLANISKSFTDSGVNISAAHCRTTEDSRAVNTFQVSVADLEQLKRLIHAIQRIEGVFSVERL
ncbi:MAG: bifunctional (p)ppGpp synthetase/guanosine-3',5'-bis(diphosphate) 3'-pyrophosphohydrolase [Deltaproteobacteria bacterium]|nr:bifunctional (p)ppGpp synthetase/guanosine-3',5'-bis(diphosphate) 3'-pyrophosphohydrolase [Deltaproteobacteria bacterium]